MKTIISSLLLLATGLSFADLAVYNGAQVTKTTSAASTTTVANKFIEVVDLTSSEIVVITLGVNAAKKKTFSVGPVSTVVKTEVQNSRTKRNSTVLAQAGTATDVDTGVVTVSSFLQVGENLRVSIRTDENIELPKNLRSSATLVISAGAADVSEFVDAKATLSLQQSLSRTINDAGDTLEAAIERITDDLLAKGYLIADA